ncbi:MAG: tyrosine--tRNA ligase [Phycisphaerae bacterium]|nr:tyrosine--tRNA ligase [Phycisphaerae bacterium]
MKGENEPTADCGAAYCRPTNVDGISCGCGTAAFASVDEQMNVLVRGCERIDTLDELRMKLADSAKSGRQLRVKLGLDPTAPDIHLGHTVVLRKMRQFQDLGHKAVLIIGSYTAKVGDPSGRSKTRPVLDDATIEKNAKTYLEQAGKVLDCSPEKFEIRFNSEWLEPMQFADVLKLAGQMTVGQMLKREDFANRYKSETPIGVHEFLYPLMQGWDSVNIQADVELGGTDQTFNNLVGRDLQRNAGKKPQIVITMPILVGLDGHEKMSKSLGNYVGVTDVPHDMFGKLMSVPDHCMVNYLTLLTSLPESEIKTLVDAKQTHPMEAKKRLAGEVTATFHSPETAEQARREWESIHQKRSATDELVVPADTPTVTIGRELLEANGEVPKLKLIVHCGFASSNSEARRLVSEKGIQLNGKVIDDSNGTIAIQSGDVLQRGKRKFVRLEVA